MVFRKPASFTTIANNVIPTGKIALPNNTTIMSNNRVNLQHYSSELCITHNP